MDRRSNCVRVCQRSRATPLLHRVSIASTLSFALGLQFTQTFPAEVSLRLC